MLTLFAVSNGLILLMTLLPISRNQGYWVRAFEFPRLQIGILALISLFGQGVTIGFTGFAIWGGLGGLGQLGDPGVVDCALHAFETP